MKFSPQIHLFLCAAMLGNMLAPSVVRADPPGRDVICARINTPSAANDEQERQKNRSNLFSSWNKALIQDFSRQHRSLKYISNTAMARNAQQGFIKTLKDNVTVICEAQHTAQTGVAQLAAKLNENKDHTEMCGRFTQFEKFYGDADAALATLQKETEERIATIRGDFLEKVNKNRTNLDEMDLKGLNTKERAPLETMTHSTGALPAANSKSLTQTGSTPYLSLREEMGILWGANVTTTKSHQAKDFKADPNSFYGGILTRVEKEAETLAALKKRLADQQAKMNSTKNDCAILPGQTPVTATTASNQPGISGPGAERPIAANPNPAASTKPGEGNGPGATTIAGNPPAGSEDRPKVPPYVAPTSEPKTPVTNPPKAAEEESWVSKNSGMLLTVGAGAAAVGGLLWYKNSEDKKAKKNAAALEAEAEAILAANSSSTATSSSTSTSTNTDSTVGGTPANSSTPQGSKLVISGIPSGSVAVNTKLSTITVAIINPSGILTQDSHTEIVVSCVQPAGCSLSGTGQAQASAGKAKFTDLRFTSPHENVKLLFTSPGFDAVASATFNVTGSSSTSTATATATATNTATSTSTTTSTATNTRQ